MYSFFFSPVLQICTAKNVVLRKLSFFWGEGVLLTHPSAHTPQERTNQKNLVAISHIKIAFCSLFSSLIDI